MPGLASPRSMQVVVILKGTIQADVAASPQSVNWVVGKMANGTSISPATGSTSGFQIKIEDLEGSGVFDFSNKKFIIVKNKNINPVADAFVYNKNGSGIDNNYSNSVNLEVSNRFNTAPGIRESYLKFNISSYQTTTSKATLYWFCGTAATQTDKFYVLANNASDNWTESGITYRNRPTETGSLASSQNLTSANQGKWIAIPLTKFSNTEIPKNKIITIKITTDAITLLRYNSKDNLANKPYLRFEGK